MGGGGQKPSIPVKGSIDISLIKSFGICFLDRKICKYYTGQKNSKQTE